MRSFRLTDFLTERMRETATRAHSTQDERKWSLSFLTIAMVLQTLETSSTNRMHQYSNRITEIILDCSSLYLAHSASRHEADAPHKSPRERLVGRR